VLELCDEPASPCQQQIPRLAGIAQAMLHDALEAFIARDAEKAVAVVERDCVVDAFYAQLFPELLTSMMSHSELVHCSTRLLSTGKYLERIADHATNIAEMVVFMVRGQDVRHLGVQKLA
jgi:phosphate transport system protein